MPQPLLHIYGPLVIQPFGLMIVIGLIVFDWLFLRHPKRAAIVSQDQFTTALIIGITTGLAGGRILYLITTDNQIDSFYDGIALWDGGLSILGCVIAILCTIPLYLYHAHIPILPFLDLVALHAPLLQSISRLGCFFAGCCYGKATTAWWSVTYTNATTLAPFCTPLHPTQLYSSALLLFIFLLLYLVVQRYTYKDGQLLAAYLFLISIERFTVDFLRADQEYITVAPWNMTCIKLFSIHQWIALFLACGALIFLCKTVYQTDSRI